MKQRAHELDSLERYTVASEAAAAKIIESYSTSFGAATKMLGIRHRSHVRNIYALVRVADELVDGATEQANISVDLQHVLLDQLEAETYRAIDIGYSSNPIVHAFAHTARVSHIGTDLISPFFHSMRTDLPPSIVATAATAAVRESADAADAQQHADRQVFSASKHEEYVYGSAEVVGLMCLKVFVREESLTPEQHEQLVFGARRLGAAFQNVNFLRDLADDTDRLGRSYLSEAGQIDDAEKDRWVAEIRAQIDDAVSVLPLLPKDARIAVDSALRLFERLTDRVAAASTADLYEKRVRVSNLEKTLLVATAALDLRKEISR